MNERLSLIASMAVLAVAGVAAYYIGQVDTAQVAQLNTTVKKLNDTLGGTVPAPVGKDNTKTVLYSGIAILFIAAVFVMLKKDR